MLDKATQIAIAVVIWLPAPAKGQPVGVSGAIVVDGDTIKSPAGVTYRITGLDAPETFRARCDGETAMGKAATQSGTPALVRHRHHRGARPGQVPSHTRPACSSTARTSPS